MEPMTLGRAFAVCKSINSPSPFADVEEKWEAIREILDAASAYVRPGGCLLYATCTLLREENQGVSQAFLARHADFSAEPFTVGGLDAPDGELTLLPHRHGTDGFYFARFIRHCSVG